MNKKEKNLKAIGEKIPDSIGDAMDELTLTTCVLIGLCEMMYQMADCNGGEAFETFFGGKEHQAQAVFDDMTKKLRRMEELSSQIWEGCRAMAGYEPEIHSAAL
jgi:hypothetical protein